jgi:hypothetical protein
VVWSDLPSSANTKNSAVAAMLGAGAVGDRSGGGWKVVQSDCTQATGSIWNRNLVQG